MTNFVLQYCSNIRNRPKFYYTMYCTKVAQNYFQVLGSKTFQDTVSFLKPKEDWAEAIKHHKNTVAF